MVTVTNLHHHHHYQYAFPSSFPFILFIPFIFPFLPTFFFCPSAFLHFSIHTLHLHRHDYLYNLSTPSFLFSLPYFLILPSLFILLMYSVSQSASTFLSPSLSRPHKLSHFISSLKGTHSPTPLFYPPTHSSFTSMYPLSVHLYTSLLVSPRITFPTFHLMTA